MDIYEINGLKFYVRCDWDTYILGDELKTNYYKIPPNIKTAIDIGAHIGGTTIKMASQGATVYAYEPELDNYNLLIANIKLNGLQDFVKAYNLGIGKVGIRTLYTVPKNTGKASFRDDIERVHNRPLKQLARVISLEEALKDIPHIDFLKFDCEGGEHEFLLNLSPELAQKIDAMSGESHFDNHDLIVNSLKRFYQVECKHGISQSTSDRFLFATKKT